MAAAAIEPLPLPPFVVGRPGSQAPVASPVGGMGLPGLHRRAKTTTSLDMSDASATPRMPSALEGLRRSRHAVTSQGGAWPRLVVRDVTGRTLDTFTTLQDAIYRASWTVKTLQEWPKTSLEWRLPKAPVPSRPDFSRAGIHHLTSYSLDLTRSYRSEVKSAPVSSQPIVEIDVDDVSFVAESLRMLPQLPSFAFLRHSLLAGQKTYLRVVGSLLLHQREVAWTDKREADYSFPGFCAGCQRAGFCYGCDRNPNPHVHEDKPMRTGGGFLFYRHDRPFNPHLHKDPRFWSTGDPEADLRNIVDKCGGLAAYESAARVSRGLAESGGMTSYLPSLPAFSRVRLLKGPWPHQTNLFPSKLRPNRMTADEEEDEEEDREEDEEEEDRGRKTDEQKDGQLLGAELEAGQRPLRKSALKKSGALSTPDRENSRERSLGLRRSVTIDTGSVRVRTGEGSDEEDLEEEGEAWTEEEEEGREGRSGRETEQYDSGIEGGTISEASAHKSRKRVALDDSALSRPSRPSTLSRPSSLSPDRVNAGTGSRSRSTPGRSRSKSPGGVAFGGSLNRPRTEALSAASKDTEESAESRKARLENIPFANRRRDVLYKAPQAYRPVKKNRRQIQARDPFSSNREYNIPKGGNFQLKKGDKKATQFMEFKRGDTGYKPPKKFELKANDNQATQFWSGPPGKKGKGKGRRRGDEDDDDEARRRRRRKQAESEDSGLDSDLRSASTRGKDNKDGENGLGDDGLNQDGGTGSDAEEDTRKKRREILKKERRVISPPGAKKRERTPSPTPPPREPTPEPSPPPTPTPPASPPPPKEIPLPDIALPPMPDLPQWKERERAERPKKHKFMVAPPTTLKEGPKKRKPPPKVRRPLKVPLQRLKTKPGEAPVNQDQVQDMQDPLDWLAKYCIINPDRLPLYEMIFETVIEDQEPKYTKPPPPTLKEVLKEAREAPNPLEELEGEGEEEKEGEKENTEKTKKKKKGSKKKKKKEEKEPSLSQLAFLERSLRLPKVGLSLPEQHLEKLCYTLDTLQEKVEALGFELEALEDKRTLQIAEKAREIFPQVASPDYVPKAKKKGKKKKEQVSSPCRQTTSG